MLIGGLVVATVAVLTTAPAVVLSVALTRGLDRYCDTGFSRLVDCNLHRSSRTTSQSTPIFTDPSSSIDTTASNSPQTFQPTYVDVTWWAIAHCPQNDIAKRLLCATPSGKAPVQAASADSDTGLPRPKPWVLTTAKNSPLIKAVHVETPLDLAAALRFYRVELSKRGWTENDGAVVQRDEAVIAFTTADGPALLRLTRQNDMTIADLSLRKPAAANAGIAPNPGQARLIFGNATDEGAVITINEQTVKLAARAGQDLTDRPDTGGKSPDSPDINLPPGKYKVTLKIASGAAQNREFEVAADETWGLLAGPDGVPLPLHLY